jgi:flagellar protein FlgJ
MANLDSVQGYAKAMQKAGYATDPNYAEKLTNVIKKVSSS